MLKKHARDLPGIMMRDDIDDHLRDIAGKDIILRIHIGEKILDDCRFCYNEGTVDELFLLVENGCYLPQSGVNLSYAYLDSLYTITSTLLDCENIDSGHSLLRITFPEKMIRQDRRKHVRLKPTGTNPIQLRFARPDSDLIDVEIMDISQGGISFFMTEEKRRFKTGDELYLDITLPEFGSMCAFTTVRNVIHLRDITRIGVQFSRISEDAHQTILQYITALELHMAKSP